jgi:hypothetical protein
MIMELGLVLIVVFVITFRSMQRQAAATATGESVAVAADSGGEARSTGARTAASASLACALLLPASLMLPPIPFHLELQAPFAGIVLGVLAIARLGNRFGSRWRLVAGLSVALSITWILLVFAAFALMLYG